MKSIVRIVSIVMMLCLMAACASTPMNADVLRAHTERNCRVQATVSPAYRVTSNPADTANVAYGACMASKGYANG